jgi:hypothetical protein
MMDGILFHETLPLAAGDAISIAVSGSGEQTMVKGGVIDQYAPIAAQDGAEQRPHVRETRRIRQHRTGNAMNGRGKIEALRVLRPYQRGKENRA